MDIRPIKSDKDYDKYLARLELIFDAEPNSKEGDEAEILSMLIENYENKYYSIDAPDPIEAIKIRMEEMNLKPKIRMKSSIAHSNNFKSVASLSLSH